MQTEKHGEWYITTPVYAGPKDQVEAATICAHQWVTEHREMKDLETYGNCEVVMERCSACRVAIRCRWKPDLPTSSNN